MQQNGTSEFSGTKQKWENKREPSWLRPFSMILVKWLIESASKCAGGIGLAATCISNLLILQRQVFSMLRLCFPCQKSFSVALICTFSLICCPEDHWMQKNASVIRKPTKRLQMPGRTHLMLVFWQRTACALTSKVTYTCNSHPFFKRL